MDMETESIRMPREMRRALCEMARRDDVSPGHLMRGLISRELARRRAAARPPNRADEQLLAPLRARLADDLALSRDWDDLQHRLRAKGYALQAAGGGLALHGHPQGHRICKASELGFSYSRLMRRFGAAFPGHAHTWVADRLLGAPDRGPETQEDDDDFEVIERF
ncbi:hypothetical protein [Marinibacterium sp. SX1]|uniref:hypothetical protein n=1 Tax=Marinibacterium sp. SX1 TaxID=3388424 RepID=UPI003D1824F4